MLAKRLVAACLLTLLANNAGAQTSPLIGTWTSTMNPNTNAIIYVTLAFLPNGQMQEKFMSRQSVAYVLIGTYQFNAASGVLQYNFTDWTPRQLCAPTGSCLAFSPPAGQLGPQPNVQIVFQNQNLMSTKSADGATGIWGRGGS
jgi:hypothetical protein